MKGNHHRLLKESPACRILLGEDKEALFAHLIICLRSVEKHSQGGSQFKAGQLLKLDRLLTESVEFGFILECLRKVHDREIIAFGHKGYRLAKGHSVKFDGDGLA